MAENKRSAKVERKTKETNITIELNLDGEGKYSIETGIPFLNHMLELFSKHSFIDINLKARGDLDVDAHHTVEDVGLALGEALKKALGDKKNITRYGYAIIPMDEALALASIDLSGRPYLGFEVSAKLSEEEAGGVKGKLFNDFFKSFIDEARCNLHIKILSPANDMHHEIEVIFKAFAKATSMAVSREERYKVPSTKGIL